MYISTHVYVQIGGLDTDVVGRERLRRQLLFAFSPFGVVVDVHMYKRGQAFVSYQSPIEATNALEGLNGSDFFGRPLKVSPSRSENRKTRHLAKHSEHDDSAMEHVATPIAVPTDLGVRAAALLNETTAPKASS